MKDIMTIIRQKYGAETWLDFVFFAANVQHVLDIHEVQQQETLFDEARDFSHRQASQDMRMQLQRRPDTPGWTGRLPGFVIAFHYGYYRLIPAQLWCEGLFVAVLVSREVITQQRKYYTWLVGDACADRLIFLEAEDAHVFFKIRNLMDQGYFIVCFADGGAGASSMSVSHGQHTVLTTALLGSEVRVRSGYAHMAYLLGCPVYQVSDVDGEGQMPSGYAVSQYDPNGFANRSHYVTECVSEIFKTFGQQLSRYPPAWEAWFYMHRYMRPLTKDKVWAAKDRYIPFELRQKKYLLDKLHYVAYPGKVQDLAG